jgi:hypothetical protein
VAWRALTVTQGQGAPCSATHKWGIWWGIMEHVPAPFRWAKWVQGVVHQHLVAALAPSLPTALLELPATAARAQVVRSDLGAVTAYGLLARESRFERGVVVLFRAHLGMVRV